MSPITTIAPTPPPTAPPTIGAILILCAGVEGLLGRAEELVDGALLETLLDAGFAESVDDALGVATDEAAMIAN